jgi:Fur family ferric uptake transcriptional regulator
VTTSTNSHRAAADGAAGLGRQTRQRRAVLRCLASDPGFLTAQALHARLLTAGEHTALATVYRTLHALTKAGLADTARYPADGQLFRLRPGRRLHSHQHYLICRSRRRAVTVTSAAVERWAAELGRHHGFTEVQHVIEATGVCAACADRAGRHDGPGSRSQRAQWGNGISGAARH